MPKIDSETIGPLLHGAARAWRLKLDERLKPMGLSQAKWRTLLHLSVASGALTQTEIAARLGIEEPTLVTLLHRLESDGWVIRKSSLHDRRCKFVYLGRRAQSVIAQINATARNLRHELIAGIPERDLQTCMRVLAQVRDKAEKGDRVSKSRAAPRRIAPASDGHNRNGQALTKRELSRRATRSSR
jgi:MarR family transcriptional regulator, transcriptional regulator for hemolysin